MTLLVSWIGVDTHGTSSAYITTDSRISWGIKIRQLPRPRFIGGRGAC